MAQSDVTLIGNVTNDPELKYTAQGAARLGFSIAVNHYWTDADGEKQERTSFFNVTAWRFLAEDAAAVLEKGVGVIIQGRLEQRSWEDDEGNKKSTIDVLANNIGLQVRSVESFERKRREGAEGGASKPVQKKAASPRKSAPNSAPEDEPF
jgi:single-strand DNA-binding protein